MTVVEIKPGAYFVPSFSEASIVKRSWSWTEVEQGICGVGSDACQEEAPAVGKQPAEEPGPFVPYGWKPLAG